MVFSSITFIYYFLPVVLLLYFIIPSKFKNTILLLCSLFFYFYGEKTYIVILLLSCLVNYIFALLIDKAKTKKFRKIFLIISIIINLGLLGYFKYTNFFIDNINGLFNVGIKSLNVVLPIGISFFTFQTLGYIIDVYNKKVKANKNIIDFACYVCLFPQLIAGPIVRYSDVAKELKNRKMSFEDFGNGIRRFVIGLAKKVLIANVIGEMINILFGLSNMSVVAYILIALGYSIQIYFDFSGYSDMAIGLGLMLGFHFLENFNYPFIANSITEFWRRWHMSLSKFFRDYVYIPLGGNRVNTLKHIRNIFVVWLLTGFWHGASWNFIIWGIYFGVILILEKYIFKNFLDKHKIFGHIYTLFLVVISFIIFSVDGFNNIALFLKNLFGFEGLPFINHETLYYLGSFALTLVISFVASTPIPKNLINKLREKKRFGLIFDIAEVLYVFALLIIVTAFLIDSSFNPFLYFRF